MRTLFLAAMAAALLSLASCATRFTHWQDVSDRSESSRPIITESGTEDLGPELAAQTDPPKQGPVARLGIIGGWTAAEATSTEYRGAELVLERVASGIGAEVAFHALDNIEIGLRYFKQSGDFDLSVNGFGQSVGLGDNINFERTTIDAFMRAYTTNDDVVKAFFQTSVGGGEIDFVEGTASPSTFNMGLGLGAIAEFENGFGIQFMAEGVWSIWKLPATSSTPSLAHSELEGRFLVGAYIRF